MYNSIDYTVFDTDTTTQHQKQTTLATTTRVLSSEGIVSDKWCACVLFPAEPNTGYTFRTYDEIVIPALLDNVFSTYRCTTLAPEPDVNTEVPVSDFYSVICVEHVLAALRGMGVDNCLIDVIGPEIPIMDGSALPFALAIEEAEVVEQDNTERQYFSLNDYCTSDEFRLSVSVDFTLWSRAIGFQAATLNSPHEFINEIAPARTFALVDDVSMLRGVKRDENTVLFDTDTNEPDNILPKMRFPNEPARHKLLDLLGDLSLSGPQFFRGSLHVDRPGHTRNIKLARELLTSSFPSTTNIS